MKLKHFEVDDLRLKKTGKYVKAIELIPERSETKGKVLKYTGVDLERDILKLVVVECLKGSGKMGIGFVKGFGLNKGAIAHDISPGRKTIVAVGKSDEDIASAIRQVSVLNGGVAVVAGGMIITEGHLASADQITGQLGEKLANAAKGLGCQLADPFAVLAQLTRTDLQELRLTENGLFDVSQSKVVELFE